MLLSQISIQCTSWSFDMVVLHITGYLLVIINLWKSWNCSAISNDCNCCITYTCSVFSCFVSFVCLFACFLGGVLLGFFFGGGGLGGGGGFVCFIFRLFVCSDVCDIFFSFISVYAFCQKLITLLCDSRFVGSVHVLSFCVYWCRSNSA